MFEHGSLLPGHEEDIVSRRRGTIYLSSVTWNSTGNWRKTHALSAFSSLMQDLDYLIDVLATSTLDEVTEMIYSEEEALLRPKIYLQADIQQIKIVKPGASISASGFKRCNTREGLLDVIIAASTTGIVEGRRKG
ncbi:hypothetical protein M405DRAFT_846853 [Rhizopogon salebrosus TDB-379]|nr:hypothetical protein M405DRAFT_846853 [Rhizopogon salebrosus TDB-379]